MKRTTHQYATIALAAIMFTAFGCSKTSNDVPLPATQQSFALTSLTSSAGTDGSRADASLLNAWGIAFSPTGTAWISSQGGHSSTVYNSAGAQVLAPVSIPTHGAATGGSPTGQVFNSSTDFKLPNTNPAKFLFAGTDGIISGWNGGTAAVVAVDRNGTSVYTGLATGSVGASNYVYAADFKSGKIDMFDKNFVLQTPAFKDAGIPAGYAPFNIQNIGGLLYVTYAQPDPVTHEKRGEGLGVVNVFNTDGSFLSRFATNGALNAPWGVAKAPAGWMTFNPGPVILIGNFGDGHINAFDAQSAQWLGTLQATNGQPIAIDGLWAISFAPTTATAINPNWLYFAAGPSNETQGLFGYIGK